MIVKKVISEEDFKRVSEFINGKEFILGDIIFYIEENNKCIGVASVSNIPLITVHSEKFVNVYNLFNHAEGVAMCQNFNTIAVLSNNENIEKILTEKLNYSKTEYKFFRRKI